MALKRNNKVQKSNKKKKDSLTVVLTILADGGSGRLLQVTVGNKEKYLEDVEALEFLREERERRWTDEDDDREKNQIFVSCEYTLC